MSHSEEKVKTVTTTAIIRRKQEGKKISMVTCYDAAFGKIVERSPVDMVLVGDSLGNVMLGFDSTIPVTIEHMLHHTSAVTRVVKRPFVAADMPFLTYATVEDALRNAGRLMQQGGAHGVKLEGGAAICPQVSALVSMGIPVIGHLGLTPQSVHALGGYKVQAKSEAARKRLIEDAKALQAAGVFCLVLEMVPQSLAKEVTKSLEIPTIGIGAGSYCDGQVLVLQDLLGFDDGFSPKFLKKYANLGQVVSTALGSFHSDVNEGRFPDVEHSFGD